MYYKGKWCTAGGKDPLFGHVDGFQIDPNLPQFFLFLFLSGLASVAITVAVPIAVSITIPVFPAPGEALADVVQGAADDGQTAVAETLGAVQNLVAGGVILTNDHQSRFGGFRSLGGVGQQRAGGRVQDHVVVFVTGIPDELRQPRLRRMNLLHQPHQRQSRPRHLHQPHQHPHLHQSRRPHQRPHQQASSRCRYRRTS